MQLCDTFFERKQERILYFNEVSSSLRKDMRILQIINDCLYPDLDDQGKDPVQA